MKPSSLLALLAVVALPACATSATSQPPPPPAPFDGLTVDQEMAIRRAMVSSDDWHLSVPPRVATLCTGSQPPPLTPDWAENMGSLRFSLRRIAECYRDGVLSGDDVVIDATASEGHRSVAMARARAFADVLASFGVREERIVINTRAGHGYSARACTIALRGAEALGAREDYTDTGKLTAHAGR